MRESRIVTAVILAFFWMPVAGQQVKKVDFVFRNNRIEVGYRLKGLGWNYRAWPELYYSTDGGKSFQGPLKKISGDSGFQNFGGRKKLIWDVFSEVEKLEGNLIFEVREKIERKPEKAENFLVYRVAETTAWGVMYARVKRWGGYADFRTNGHFSWTSDYTCDRSGQTEQASDEVYYRMGKRERLARWGMTAGIAGRIGYPFYWYAGLGYGKRQVVWEAGVYAYKDDRRTGSWWLENRDDSCSGLEWQVGAGGRYRRFLLVVGLIGLRGDLQEMTGGIGVFF